MVNQVTGEQDTITDATLTTELNKRKGEGGGINAGITAPQT